MSPQRQPHHGASCFRVMHISSDFMTVAISGCLQWNLNVGAALSFFSSGSFLSFLPSHHPQTSCPSPRFLHSFLWYLSSPEGGHQEVPTSAGSVCMSPGERPCAPLLDLLSRDADLCSTDCALRHL